MRYCHFSLLGRENKRLSNMLACQKATYLLSACYFKWCHLNPCFFLKMKLIKKAPQRLLIRMPVKSWWRKWFKKRIIPNEIRACSFITGCHIKPINNSTIKRACMSNMFKTAYQTFVEYRQTAVSIALACVMCHGCLNVNMKVYIYPL